MRARRWAMCAGILGALVSAGAFAQDVEKVEPTQAGTKNEIPPLKVQINGGVGGFTGELGDSSNIGPVYGVSASTKAASIQDVTTNAPSIDIEGSYEGSNLGVNSDFGDGSLWRNNLTTMVKASVQVKKLDPYIGVGIGATRLNATEGAEEAGFGDDWLAEVPVAAGLDFNINENLTAGARGTYRFMFFDEFADDVAIDNPGGGHLAATITVGGQF